MNKAITPWKRARRTGRWATTMTKQLISRVGGRPTWYFVDFLGPSGGESRGIVDLLAVRKDHRAAPHTIKRGDRFDLVLIQIKGGNAPWPSADNVRRLREVARHHRAKAIVLSVWHPGSQPFLFRLGGGRTTWQPVVPEELFA